jgi:ElaB/YqjD/DUF883 family membrane-anchored ribosome-binding protein
MATTPKSGGSSKPEHAGGSTTQYATDVKNKVQETASNVADRAKDAASSAASRAQDMASNLGQKAQNVAANVGQRAQDMAANLGERADDARSSVGDQMKSLAGQIRDKAPHEGLTGRAASAVAQGLESGGSYIKQHDFADMAEDMTSLVRRYPLQAVLVGIGIGFLLGRTMRS